MSSSAIVKCCTKCAQTLGEAEFVPTPLVGKRGKGGSLPVTQGPDVDPEDDSQSFVMVEKRSDDVKRKIERELKRELTGYIYWEQVPLKHALCRTCVDFILNKQLRDDTQKLKEKQEAAEEFLAKAKRSTSFFTAAATHERYELAIKERERLRAELHLLQRKLTEEKNNIAAIKAETKALSEKERQFAYEAMRWRGSKHVYQERWDASMRRYETANNELTLKSTILNDAFHVWEEKPPYFSINGIRMGRKPSNDSSEKQQWTVAEGATALPASQYDVVEWSEVNAAWGEACLLLCVLASRAQVGFKEYTLIPRGSKSLVQEKRNPNNVHKLYFESEGGAAQQVGQTGGPLGWGFSLLGLVTPNQNIESFNQAMMGFLVCLKELSDVARDSPRGIQLNLKSKLYPIKAEAPPAGLGGKEPPATSLYMDATIRGLSIRTTTDPSDARRWTDACKFALSNVKWLSVWIAVTGGARKT